MNERERAILRGKPVVPQTADEAAIKYAIDNGGGGGSSLPEVTSADNGDVLTVVEGAWSKAEPSGGREFVITGDLTPTMDASGAITALAWSNISVSSADEVNAAIEAGKPVVLRGSFSPQAGIDLFFDFPMSGRTTISDEVEGGLPDSFYFSGEIVLKNNEGDSFAPDVIDVASMLSQGDGGIYVVSAIKPQNVDHYSFGFTATPDGQGGYSVTADSGVTDAGIIAALAVTPNVYAIVDFAGTIIRIRISVNALTVWVGIVLLEMETVISAAELHMDGEGGHTLTITPLSH